MNADVTRALHMVFNGIAVLYASLFVFFKLEDLYFSALVTFCSVLGLYFIRLRGAVRVANIGLLIVSNLAVLFHSLMIGIGSGIPTFFFSLAVIPFVVFDATLVSLRYIFVSVPVFCWAIYNSLGDHVVSRLLMDPVQMQFTYFVTGVLNFLIIVSGLWLFSRSVNHYMQVVVDKNELLAEKNSELEVALDQLKKTQAENEELVRKTAYAELMKGVAHEIKNPMGILLNRSELVLNQLDRPEKIKLFAEMVHRNIKRLDGLTKSMLKYQHDAGKDRYVFDLSDMLASIVELIKPSLKQANLDFEVSIPRQMSAYGNPDYIYSALLNLVHNAVQYTPKGSITLKASFSEIFRPGEEGVPAVRIQISDTGEGIAAEDLEKIFIPYFSGRKTSDNVGLGLAMAHKTILESDGEIKVTSERRKGTTFTVLIPQIKIS